MPQGFRVCTADPTTKTVVSVHHTATGARSYMRRNPHVALDAYQFPFPYAISEGDILPAAGILLDLDPHGPNPKRAKRKRIGE